MNIVLVWHVTKYFLKENIDCFSVITLCTIIIVLRMSHTGPLVRSHKMAEDTHLMRQEGQYNIK